VHVSPSVATAGGLTSLSPADCSFVGASCEWGFRS
jgi:hypothetical protein